MVRFLFFSFIFWCFAGGLKVSVLSALLFFFPLLIWFSSSLCTASARPLLPSSPFSSTAIVKLRAGIRTRVALTIVALCVFPLSFSLNDTSSFLLASCICDCLCLSLSLYLYSFVLLRLSLSVSLFSPFPFACWRSLLFVRPGVLFSSSWLSKGSNWVLMCIVCAIFECTCYLPEGGLPSS